MSSVYNSYQYDFSVPSSQLTGNSNGGPIIHGEYESMKLINEIVEAYAPKPLAWGHMPNAKPASPPV